MRNFVKTYFIEIIKINYLCHAEHQQLASLSQDNCSADKRLLARNKIQLANTWRGGLKAREFSFFFSASTFVFAQ